MAPAISSTVPQSPTIKQLCLPTFQSPIGKFSSNSIQLLFSVIVREYPRADQTLGEPLNNSHTPAEAITDDSVIAVFSDIHSNLEALKAVIEDMDACGIEQRYCLGDIVGYGANPSQCLELVRSMRCSIIQGNHDAAAGTDISLEMMSPGARFGIEFTRKKLSAPQRRFLRGLPVTIVAGDHQFVHASLDEPADWNYVINQWEAQLHFSFQERSVCFCGHTHVPAIWHQSAKGKIRVAKGTGSLRLPRGGKALINVGSVGQPRDGAAEACYVLFDCKSRRVEFRRVPYDNETTCRKILRAKLPPENAERLRAQR